MHEGSFHAFARLAERGTAVAEPGLTFGSPIITFRPAARVTTSPIPRSRAWCGRSRRMRRSTAIRLFGLDDPRQGIVHVVGPEQGLTLPGLLIVCGDSHTSTHGALGAYAFGIGASEVAHVLMTQTIWQRQAEDACGSPSTATLRPASRRRTSRSPSLPISAPTARPATRSNMPARDQGAVDRRPADAVQHVDRGRRALRNGRARR